MIIKDQILDQYIIMFDMSFKKRKQSTTKYSGVLGNQVEVFSTSELVYLFCQNKWLIGNMEFYLGSEFNGFLGTIYVH